MNLIRRLYRGETRIEFVGHSKRWYAASGVLIAICIISMVFRGFNLGIEFKGGTQFQLPTSNSYSVTDVQKAFDDAGVGTAGVPQRVGSGSTHQYVVKAENLKPAETSTVTQKVASELKINSGSISSTSVSSTWGSDISKKAIQALVVFLIAVSIYISIRFQWRMAVSAIVALLHDLLLTAGIYSIVGFEVTPSTVVGLLTILGFSLYDTVVVFDKVAENSKDLTSGSRMTFSQAANLAVNQTLMRSINTSLISLLPVAGLLFVGAGILGVGTIEDLALILFVGLATGAYSSLFLATPIVADLTERQPAYRELARRVANKRATEAARAEAGQPVIRGSRGFVGGPAPAPRPGARPARPSGGSATAVAERPEPATPAKATPEKATRAPARRTGSTRSPNRRRGGRR